MEELHYKRIVAMVDKGLNLVELVEEHPCPNGAEWVVYQYQRTSPLIVSAWREGNKHHFVTKIGKADLNLIPSISAAGIEEVFLEGENVHIVHAGLAGAGVGAEMRKKAENVVDVIIHQKGGGSKLGKAEVITPKMEKVIVGIDDTDTKEEGATWVLANEIGKSVEKEGYGYYMDHTIVQLYPGNPNKTQNCVSIALTFAVYPKYKYKIDELIKKELKEKSLSDDTSMAIYYGITPSKSMKLFALRAKRELVSIEDARAIAMQNDIRVVKVNGEGGIIGAVAALGLAEHHDIAAKLPEDL
ncbi:methanogenesis marker protein 11 [Methanotorris formicicus]|uniref:Methanogenesis marker protein 11 n=1 Tax=Methanotorris formicicus Mc-S-70 TaxID=647171 RepID=H1KZR1_9EURY|nr:methanogenesis marker protein 11 [Methanotorris formicicus]EHP85702.1 methanogenesis marker protein 11 [Methanotorris formicicus Mc-S-70]